MDEWVGEEVRDLIPLLAAFEATAQQGHITRAAHLLDVPQSSLSRRLRAVEKAVGVALVRPEGRGIALTTAGRDLYERIRGIVKSLDDAICVVRAHADPDSGTVRFGFPLTLGPVSMPSLLADFHAAAPRIRLQMVQAPGEALADMIRQGRLDLAVMIPAPDDLPVKLLGHQRIHLYVGCDHRLAERRQVHLAELAGETFIANPRTYHLRRLLDSWCAEAGFTPEVAVEITEFETLRALVGQGLGVALLPEPETAHPDLRAVRVTGDRDRTIGLVRGHHRPTPAVARLHDHIAAHGKWAGDGR